MARAMLDEAMLPGRDAGAADHELVFAPVGPIGHGAVAAAVRGATAAARR
jgi:hypothetical protein